MRRIFHGIQMIQVAEELIEAVDGGQEFVEIAEVIFAELAGGIALRFERGSNRAGLSGQADVGDPPDRPWSCRCGWAAHR